jgi:type IV secretory pathway TrbD component
LRRILFAHALTHSPARRFLVVMDIIAVVFTLSVIVTTIMTLAGSKYGDNRLMSTVTLIDIAMLVLCSAGGIRALLMLIELKRQTSPLATIQLASVTRSITLFKGAMLELIGVVIFVGAARVTAALGLHIWQYITYQLQMLALSAALFQVGSKLPYLLMYVM